MNYDEACKSAATAQGLDPVAQRLTAERFPFAVEQTGGMTMVLAVTDEASGRVWGVIRDGEGDRAYLLCQYTAEAWREGGEETLVHRHLSLDDVVVVLDSECAPRTG